MPRRKLLHDRSQIIDVAERLIETDGLEAVSMRRLSKEMGVSDKTLYNYVLNAEAVLREVLIRSFSGLYETEFAMMSDMIAAGMDAAAAFAKAYALSLFDFARQHRDICVYLMGRGYELYHNDAELRLLYDPFGSMLMSVGGESDTKRLKELYFLYEGAVHSLIRNHNSGIKKLSREEYVKLIDLLIEKLLK